MERLAAVGGEAAGPLQQQADFVLYSLGVRFKAGPAGLAAAAGCGGRGVEGLDLSGESSLQLLLWR